MSAALRETPLFIAGFFVVLILTGCAGASPKQVPQAPDRIAAPVTLPKLIVTFRTTGYRVDIGPALAIYLSQRLPASVADVWVTDFEATCKPTDGQWPRHICAADYRVLYRLDGRPQNRRDVEIIEAGSATDDKATMVEQADLLALAIAEQIVRSLGME